VAIPDVSLWLLATLGFTVGTLSGFFGVGGAFIMTPALNILGYPMVYAIGTDLAMMVGSSTVAAIRHFRFGNVDIRLGLYMLLGTAVGVWLGKTLVFALVAAGGADTVLRIIYMLLLFGLSGFMVYDYLTFLHHDIATLHDDRGEPVGTKLSRRLQAIRIPPFVRLPVSGIAQISLWIPIVVGMFTGFLAALLGVGGGFIRMPALIYGLGVPTSVAIGTDLFEIVFSSSIGAYFYALAGKVHLPTAVVMLIGATLGAEMGSYATLYVRGMRVRFYFALTIFGAAVSVVLKQLGEWLDIPVLSMVAMYLILGVAVLMMLTILVKLVAGLLTRYQEPDSRFP
jgi:hypothetical protein